jgi:hypothetical protein
MSYNLHGDTERAREALWARKEDAKAIEALRKQMQAESDLQENLAHVRARQGSA